MARSLQVLDRTDLFGSLPPDLLEDLAGRTELRKYERGEHVCRKGDVARELWIVFSGRIAISARASDGRESVMAVLGPGALFGEMPLFDGEVRSADARALTAAHLIEVPYDDVRAVLQARPEVLWPVTKIMARRLRTTNEALADSMFLDVTGRTAKRLLEIAGDEDEFRMPLTQEELAGMVGASRERVNKAIATFVKLGWLEIQGRTVYRFVNRSELEARSQV
jgi:CRP/FNR family cyclic AMP-dependent transcriptional regulator